MRSAFILVQTLLFLQRAKTLKGRKCLPIPEVFYFLSHLNPLDYQTIFFMLDKVNIRDYKIQFF